MLCLAPFSNLTLPSLGSFLATKRSISNDGFSHHGKSQNSPINPLIWDRSRSDNGCGIFGWLVVYSPFSSSNAMVGVKRSRPRAWWSHKIELLCLSPGKFSPLNEPVNIAIRSCFSGLSIYLENGSRRGRRSSDLLSVSLFLAHPILLTHFFGHFNGGHSFWGWD